MRVYVDTGVLLANIISNDPNHEKAKRLVQAFRGYDLVVSELSIIEMFSVLSRNLDMLEIEDVELVEDPQNVVSAIVVLALERAKARFIPTKPKNKNYALGPLIITTNPIINRAIQLSARIKLKTLDLLHIAYAEHLQAEILLTLDKDITKKAHLIESETGIKIKETP